MGQPTDRRSMLRWAIHGLGGLIAAVLGIPAIAYLIDARNRPARPSGLRPVARLDELTVGKPHLAVVSDSRRDAWTLHPRDLIGRVWLIRGPNNHVNAFTTICPHLGCSINFTGSEFHCPCHNSRFELNGQREERPGRPNPAPRGMDSLEVRLQDGIVLVKYEDFFQSRPEKIAKA